VDCIRIAQINDLEAAAAIVRDAAQSMNEQGIYQWDEIYPNNAVLQKDIEQRHMHLMVRGGEIVGLITLNEEQSPEYGDVSWSFQGRVRVVHRLTVAQRHQGKGLASRLMDFVETDAISQGYDAIRLDAFTLNPIAIHLYESRDYKKAGTIRFRKGLFFCYEKNLKSGLI
jgi:ribosomal protein S18 acetylase RimI-like enzyme